MRLFVPQSLSIRLKPFIFVGHGVLISKAEESVRLLAEKAGIPVASTLMGLSAFPTEHPLYVGMLGMHGNYGPNVLTNEADVIIAIGMRFDDRVTGELDSYAKKAKIIHRGIDPAEINKAVRCEVGIISDAKKGVESLIPHITPRTHDLWFEEFRRCNALEIEKVIDQETHPTEGQLKMGEVIRRISELTNGEAVIVADVWPTSDDSCSLL